MNLFILLVIIDYFVNGFSMGCMDWRGNRIANGVEFRSRQDPCETCTCEEGHSVRCMSVHCAPPKCSLWEMIEGECCQFHCLEPADTPHDRNGKINISSIDHTIIPADAKYGENVGLRLIASTVTSFLILALLLFMVHRLRQRRILIMMQRIAEDSTNDESLAYQIDATYEFSPYDEPPPPYTPPKPPYIPLDEAPPPYDQINNNNNGEVNQFVNSINEFRDYNSNNFNFGQSVSHAINLPLYTYSSSMLFIKPQLSSAFQFHARDLGLHHFCFDLNSCSALSASWDNINSSYNHCLYNVNNVTVRELLNLKEKTPNVFQTFSSSSPNITNFENKSVKNSNWVFPLMRKYSKRLQYKSWSLKYLNSKYIYMKKRIPISRIINLCIVDGSECYTRCQSNKYMSDNCGNDCKDQYPVSFFSPKIKTYYDETLCYENHLNDSLAYKFFGNKSSVIGEGVQFQNCVY